MEDFREFLVMVGVGLAMLALLGFAVAIACFLGYEAGLCLVDASKPVQAGVSILVIIGLLGPLLILVAMANKLLEKWLMGIEL